MEYAVIAEARRNRRVNTERRAQYQRLGGYWLLHGRRHRGRRRGEGFNRYVDRYDLQMALILMGIMVLCAVDAYCTLTLIERGAQEINPLMAVLLSWDEATFTHTKLGLTASGLLVLAAHKDFLIFNRLLTVHIIKVCFVGYALLVYYEGVLLLA